MITLYAEIDLPNRQTFIIDNTNGIRIERTITDRADIKLPSFGIISNVADIEFTDFDFTILNCANDGELIKGLPCRIKIKDTISGKTELLGVFETDNWEYDNNNQKVRVSLKDDLEEWQDIYIESIPYNVMKPQEESFMWLYSHLSWLTRTTYGYDILSPAELDTDTKNMLNQTFIKYPMIESGTLWQQWDKLCKVCQLHIYKNESGRIICRYNGGN